MARRILREARDPLAPADPSATVDTEIDPSSTLPQRGAPPNTPDLDGGEYEYWLRDGVTPYRTQGPVNKEVFSKDDDGWMLQHQVDKSTLWPSSAGEVAGIIPGGRSRLTEPGKGAMAPRPGPDDDFAPVESPDLIAEADATGDLPPDTGDDVDGSDPSQVGDPSDLPDLGDLPEGGMNEQQIRDAGLRIDLPYDDPLPVALKYKDTGQKTWTPSPGFRQGMPPIDAKLADDLGVPRDLGQAQEGTSGSSGGEPGAGA
jgi:hypothetical protein